MAENTTNYQCPACTGPLRFDSASGKLCCDYCGSTYDVAQVEALYGEKQARADQAAEAAEKAASSGPVWGEMETGDLSSRTCTSCGAELVCGPETAATTCPYCGNPTVLGGKLSGKLYVIKTFLAQALNAEFIDWYVQLLAFVGGRAPVYCYMENNKLQDPFFQQVFKPLVAKVRREQGVQLYIRGDEEKKTDKATRIEANLEPMNRAGNLILNEQERDNPHMRELLDQFTLFTLSLRYPADGPDAVEGGNRIIDEIQHRAEPPLTRSRADIRTRNKRRL